MTKYREFLRLTALGLSQRNIVQSIGVSQKTVVKVQIASPNGHLCHIRRTAQDIISGQVGTH